MLFRSSILGGFHQLQEDAAGILRVDEVDAGIGGSPLGLREQQPEAVLTQDGTHVIQVVHAVGELLDAGAAVAVQPFRDGGVLVEGGFFITLQVFLKKTCIFVAKTNKTTYNDYKQNPYND